MDFLKKEEKINLATTTTTSVTNKEQAAAACTRPFCFFCTMKEQDTFKRRAGISTCFKQLPLREDQGNVLVLSSLWQIAMTQPDDPEFPSLGIFECMARLISKGIHNKTTWLQRDQNIYIPYYAAHVIGSYTLNNPEFAEKAVSSGVIPPLLELMRGKMSWVEERVAVRALGHLASYQTTFKAVAQYEEEVVRLAMNLASTCHDVVYVNFVGVKKDKRKRLKYHCDLLTRGVGGFEMENCKAEEWATQLQFWSLNILNCFACKERSLHLICKADFLKELCGMWGGLANHTSPAGVGLIRILCYSKYGRKKISELKEVVGSLCNLSRSSDDWQYMGIDCLLLLLKDPKTRCEVIDIAGLFLVDLVEIRSLGDRSNLGEWITKALLPNKLNNNHKNRKIEGIFEQVWSLKVERRKKERVLSQEEIEERRVLVDLMKQEASQMFFLGEIEEAVVKYSEALELCPLKLRKDRMVIYSNRAQCQLLIGDADAAIRDSTRALCLSSPVNSHSKSLWRRSQAYDMKGLAKESLMDCLMFINGCIKSEGSKRVRVPYYAARMISKQMDATWVFKAARSKVAAREDQENVETKMMKEVQESAEGKGDLYESSNDKQCYHDEVMRMMMKEKGLSTILEEPMKPMKEEGRRKMEIRTRRI